MARPTPARLRAVEAILESTALEVAALPRSSLQAMAGPLHEARLELEADLRKWLSQVNGADKFTTQQHRNALVQLRGALDEISKLEPALAAALNKGTDLADKLAVRTVQRDLASFSQLFGESIRPIPLIQVNAILTDKGRRTRINENRASAIRYAGQVGEDVRKQLAIGLIKGETIRQLTKRLVGPGSGINWAKIADNQLGQVAGPISQKQARRWEGWANRVVRTEVLNAYNKTADDTIDAVHKYDKRIMKRWNAANDARTCAFCRSLEGQVVPNDSDFTGGISAPPAHPNCRCAVCPWRADWEEQAGAHYGPHVEPDEIPDKDEPPTPPSAPVGSQAPPAAPPPVAAPPAPIQPKPEPAPPAVAAGSAFPEDFGDPTAFANAMVRAGNVSKNGKGEWAQHNRGMKAPAPEVQHEVRDGLRRLLKRYDIVDRDNGDLRFTSGVTKKTNEHNSYYRATSSTMAPGVAGYHVSNLGAMVINEWSHNEAMNFVRARIAGRAVTEGQVNGFHTLVHEALHGYSPLDIAPVATGKGAAMAVEEISTELAARRVMRESFNLEHDIMKPPASEADLNRKRAYDRYIIRMAKIVTEKAGVSWERAIEELEHAAMQVKKTGPQLKTSEGFVAAFMEHMGISRKAREEVVKAVMAGGLQ